MPGINFTQIYDRSTADYYTGILKSYRSDSNVQTYIENVWQISDKKSSDDEFGKGIEWYKTYMANLQSQLNTAVEKLTNANRSLLERTLHEKALTLSTSAKMLNGYANGADSTVTHPASRADLNDVYWKSNIRNYPYDPYVGSKAVELAQTANGRVSYTDADSGYKETGAYYDTLDYLYSWDTDRVQASYATTTDTAVSQIHAVGVQAVKEENPATSSYKVGDRIDLDKYLGIDPVTGNYSGKGIKPGDIKYNAAGLGYELDQGDNPDLKEHLEALITEVEELENGTTKIKSMKVVYKGTSVEPTMLALAGVEKTHFDLNAGTANLPGGGSTLTNDPPNGWTLFSPDKAGTLDGSHPMPTLKFNGVEYTYDPYINGGTTHLGGWNGVGYDGDTNPTWDTNPNYQVDTEDYWHWRSWANHWDNTNPADKTYGIWQNALTTDHDSVFFGIFSWTTDEAKCSYTMFKKDVTITGTPIARTGKDVQISGTLNDDMQIFIRDAQGNLKQVYSDNRTGSGNYSGTLNLSDFKAGENTIEVYATSGVLSGGRDISENVDKNPFYDYKIREPWMSISMPTFDLYEATGLRYTTRYRIDEFGNIYDNFGTSGLNDSASVHPADCPEAAHNTHWQISNRDASINASHDFTEAGDDASLWDYVPNLDKTGINPDQADTWIGTLPFSSNVFYKEELDTAHTTPDSLTPDSNDKMPELSFSGREENVTGDYNVAPSAIIKNTLFPSVSNELLTYCEQDPDLYNAQFASETKQGYAKWENFLDGFEGATYKKPEKDHEATRPVALAGDYMWHDNTKGTGPYWFSTEVNIPYKDWYGVIKDTNTAIPATWPLPTAGTINVQAPIGKDSYAEVYVNGILAGKVLGQDQYGNSQMRTVDIQQYLKIGQNTIAVKASNNGSDGNSQGKINVSMSLTGGTCMTNLDEVNPTPNPILINTCDSGDALNDHVMTINSMDSNIGRWDLTAKNHKININGLKTGMRIDLCDSDGTVLDSMTKDATNTIALDASQSMTKGIVYNGYFKIYNDTGYLYMITDGYDTILSGDTYDFSTVSYNVDDFIGKESLAPNNNMDVTSYIQFINKDSSGAGIKSKINKVKIEIDGEPLVEDYRTKRYSTWYWNGEEGTDTMPSGGTYGEWEGNYCLGIDVLGVGGTIDNNYYATGYTPPPPSPEVTILYDDVESGNPLSSSGTFWKTEAYAWDSAHTTRYDSNSTLSSPIIKWTIDETASATPTHSWHFGMDPTSYKVTIQKVIIDDNVEGGTNGWNATGCWQVDTRQSDSATHSWFYGDKYDGLYWSDSVETGNQGWTAGLPWNIDSTGADSNGTYMWRYGIPPEVLLQDVSTGWTLQATNPSLNVGMDSSNAADDWQLWHMETDAAAVRTGTSGLYYGLSSTMTYETKGLDTVYSNDGGSLAGWDMSHGDSGLLSDCGKSSGLTKRWHIGIMGNPSTAANLTDTIVNPVTGGNFILYNDGNGSNWTNHDCYCGNSTGYIDSNPFSISYGGAFTFWALPPDHSCASIYVQVIDAVTGAIIPGGNVLTIGAGGTQSPGKWAEHTVNLAPYAGHDVKIRLYEDTPNGHNSEADHGPGVAGMQIVSAPAASYNSAEAISPLFTQKFAGAQLTFDYKYAVEAERPTTMDTRKVFWKNAANVWTELAVNYTAQTSGGWQHQTVALPAGAVQVKFAFDTKDCLNNDDFGWAIDNVQIEYPNEPVNAALQHDFNTSAAFDSNKTLKGFKVEYDQKYKDTSNPDEERRVEWRQNNTGAWLPFTDLDSNDVTANAPHVELIYDSTITTLPITNENKESELIRTGSTSTSIRFAYDGDTNPTNIFDANRNWYVDDIRIKAARVGEGGLERSVDLSDAYEAKVTFDQTYYNSKSSRADGVDPAQTGYQSEDMKSVEYSIDCGATWIVLESYDKQIPVNSSGQAVHLDATGKDSNGNPPYDFINAPLDSNHNPGKIWESRDTTDADYGLIIPGGLTDTTASYSNVKIRFHYQVTDNDDYNNLPDSNGTGEMGIFNKDRYWYVDNIKIEKKVPLCPEGILTSGDIPLTSYDYGRFTFKTDFNTDSVNAEKMYVEYSNDGGPWEAVYTDTTYATRETYYTGTAGMTSKQYYLKGGVNTQIRYRFESDNKGNEGKGWHVDNVKIVGVKENSGNINPANLDIPVDDGVVGLRLYMDKDKCMSADAPVKITVNYMEDLDGDGVCETESNRIYGGLTDSNGRAAAGGTAELDNGDVGFNTNTGAIGDTIVDNYYLRTLGSHTDKTHNNLLVVGKGRSGGVDKENPVLDNPFTTLLKEYVDNGDFQDILKHNMLNDVIISASTQDAYGDIITSKMLLDWDWEKRRVRLQQGSFFAMYHS